MSLFADRFALTDEKHGVDLATGNHVVLVVSSAGGCSEQQHWALKCDALQKRRAPAVTRLIDYGVVGESQRFEAWDRESGTVVDGSEGSLEVASPAVAAIAELFDGASGVRPRVAALRGYEAADTRTAVFELARAARLHGFVPIAAHLAGQYDEWLRNRSLFIIAETGRSHGWHLLLEAALTTPRPHVLLFVGREEMRGFDTLRMPAGRSRCTLAPPVRGMPGERAAEQAATYGQSDQPDALDAIPAAFPSSPPGRAWPVAGELIELRRRLEVGTRLVQQGRHAPGERQLRQALHGLARRQDWSHAAEGAHALAAMLIDRGRPREARVMLESAAGWWRRAGDEVRLIDVAVLGGAAWTDLARLDEAEGALAAAVSASRALCDDARSASASLAMARVLFWRGQYGEADRMAGAVDVKTAGDRTAIAIRSLRSRIAVGLREFDRAVSESQVALAGAESAGQPCLVADAAGAVAFAHLSVGDLAAVEHDVAQATAAARAARQPITAACSRLCLVEAYRRTGRRTAAARVLAHLRGGRSSRLPPLLAACCGLLGEVLPDGSDVEGIVTRHVAATGLHALSLHVPANHAYRGSGPFAPLVNDIVQLLDVCHTSDDERTVLTDVCRHVRKRTVAVAAAFAVTDGGGSRLFVSDGKRVELQIADRAIAADTTIAPHRCDERVEAAAPVRYGGVIIGALIARWTVGTPHDLSRAAPLLTAAAAAVAPILASALARQHRASSEAVTTLLGGSQAMSAVRDGIERAASAPFAALVEGESGSGKELVARALHRAGPRRDRPFCTLNCAALPDDLVEAELFGHARGAFTGAVAERPGVFEEAHGGTLLLDEVGELSLRAQAKVLRVIQEGELRRIGENMPRCVDVRIVSATNRDLRQEVASGRFRLDLLYRLDVLRITVPPLRERRDDIAVLAEHFWREATARINSRATLSPAAVALLVQYDWPGNARELQNVMASLAVRSPKRGLVPASALGPQFSPRCAAESSRLDVARRAFEERFVRAALVRTGGHRSRAAEELGISRQGLTKLMTRLGLLE